MKHISLLINLILIASMLAACGGATESEVVEKEVTRVVKETVVETVKETVVIEGTPQTVEQQVTKVVEVEKIVTATPETEPEPAVGGKLVYVLSADPRTLDPHKTSLRAEEDIMQYLGASLITKDPLTDEFIPYLAEDWTVAEDGLTYEFTLRKDVKFHDGTPFTAHEYAWTLQRAMDPRNQAPIAAMLTGVVSAEALDDYTLQLKLAWPNYPLLANMALIYDFHPLSPAYVEQMGEDYGRHPMSVGPFKFKEWQTGEKIVLERNPDFAWGPEHTHGGAPYIETIEFRIIPEYATVVAGLESGEIDYAGVQAKDVDRIKDTGQFQILGALLRGISPFVTLNTVQPPFDDVRVRQAFNLAVNRDALVQVVMHGRAIPHYGPISPSVPGYWPGTEYIGYHYNLDEAKSLMEEAGYSYNDDGMLEKDGQALALVLKTTPGSSKTAEVLQEQFGALGVEIQIEQLELGILREEYASGNYTLGLRGLVHPDISLLFAMFHSSMIGAWNSSFVNEAQVDQFIADIVYTADDKVHEEAAIALQRHVVEQAYIVPLYTPIINKALSSRIQGAVFASAEGLLELYDAYIEMTAP